MKKIKPFFFEEAELPLICSGRDCGQIGNSVFFLSKDLKIIQISIEKGKYSEALIFHGCKVLTVEQKLGLLGFLTEHDDLVVIRSSNHEVLTRQQTPVLMAYKYTTLAFVGEGSLVLSAVQFIKKYQALTENVLYLYSHKLELTSTLKIKLGSPQSNLGSQKTTSRLGSPAAPSIT